MQRFSSVNNIDEIKNSLLSKSLDLSDLRIIKLISELGMQGYGVYCALIQFYLSSPKYFSLKYIDFLAQRIFCSPELIRDVIEGYDLFTFIDGVYIPTGFLQEPEPTTNLKAPRKSPKGMAPSQISEQNRANAKKRWDAYHAKKAANLTENAENAETPTENVGVTHNAIEIQSVSACFAQLAESQEKENKEKSTKKEIKEKEDIYIIQKEKKVKKRKSDGLKTDLAETKPAPLKAKTVACDKQPPAKLEIPVKPAEPKPAKKPRKKRENGKINSIDDVTLPPELEAYEGFKVLYAKFIANRKMDGHTLTLISFQEQMADALKALGKYDLNAAVKKAVNSGWRGIFFESCPLQKPETKPALKNGKIDYKESEMIYGEGW